MNAKIALKAILELQDKERAQLSQRFFKTAPGEYGEGDLFLGIRVPVLRKLAKEFQTLPLDDALILLKSKWHEVRLFALFLMTNLYQKSKSNPSLQKEIYHEYLNHSQYINNWDLVDSSAHKIVGPYLENHPNALIILKNLALSEMLWERRIAMVSCWHFNKGPKYTRTMELAEILLHDHEDLMHKAVGWMLREMGKKQPEALIEFLDEFATQMPRTMLRYSIEKLEESKRQYYLKLPRS